MSHAEAFGLFRSFAVGLEKNARALRRVLEEADEQKLGNGKDNSSQGGIGARCAGVFECASPEATVKELVAEVAEQETVLRGVQAMMRTDKPVDEVIDKYQALLEYNQLAFVDLEERLSAYGYVRPAVAASTTGDSGPSLSKASASSEQTELVSTRAVRSQENDGGAAAAGGAAGEDSIAIDISSRGHEHDPSAPAREENAPARQEDHGLQVDATAAAASDVGDGEAPARAPLKSDDEISRVEAAGLESNAEGAEVVFTPVRQAPVVVEEAEGDADSPATPTLAEWEISEETREMLRRDQQLRRQSGGGKADTSAVAVARSLADLLAENLTVAGGPKNRDSAAARSSVSSNWSPPHLHTPSLGPRGPGDGGGDSDGDDDGSGRIGTASATTQQCGTPAAGVSGDATDGAEVADSPLGSDPPTPLMKSFEDCHGGKRYSPDRRGSVGGNGKGGSSEGTPEPFFTSPMKTPLGRSLLEATMSCGKQKNLTTSEEVSSLRPSGAEDGCPLDVSSDPTPGWEFVQGDEGSLGDNLSTGRQDEFWDGDSPASRVTPSRDTSGGSLPSGATMRWQEKAASPGTPHTPPMLSPRHHERSSPPGGIATGSARSKRSNREAPMTPTVANSSVYASDSGDNADRRDSGGGSVSGGRGVYNSDDDDECATPQLSSPPRAELMLSKDRDMSDFVVPASAELFRRRLEEAEAEDAAREAATSAMADGPLELVSEEEYSRAPTFLTIQVSRDILNDAIRNLNAYASPRLGSPSEMLLTFNEMIDIIDQGELSRTLLLSAAHLKRVEMKGSRMYRIRAAG